MRRFEIIDGARRNARPCAVLNWDDEADALSIDIGEQANETDVPMLFIPFLRKGMRHIDDTWARRWIEERIVPASRQNLGEVLRANNLRFYEPMGLLVAGGGRCAQDDFFIREVGEKSHCETTVQNSGSEVAPCGGKTAAKRVGQALREAREGAGLSQVELAERSGLGQPTLSRIENGRANPTVGLLEDIARALGKDLEIRFV